MVLVVSPVEKPGLWWVDGGGVVDVFGLPWQPRRFSWGVAREVPEPFVGNCAVHVLRKGEVGILQVLGNGSVPAR